MCQLWNLGVSNPWNTQGLSTPIQRLLYVYNELQTHIWLLYGRLQDKLCPQTTGSYNQIWRKLTAINTLISQQLLGFRFTTDNTVNSKALPGNELGYSVKAVYQNNELKHCSVSDWCVVCVCGSHIHCVMICLLLHSNDAWPWPLKGIQCTSLLWCRTKAGISEFSYSTKVKWSYTRWYSNLFEFLKATFQLQVFRPIHT